MLPGMPRSLAAVLTDRLDRINALASDLARANGGSRRSPRPSPTLSSEKWTGYLARCDGRSATSQVLSLAPDQIVVSCPSNRTFPKSGGSGSS